MIWNWRKSWEISQKTSRKLNYFTSQRQLSSFSSCWLTTKDQRNTIWPKKLRFLTRDIGTGREWRKVKMCYIFTRISKKTIWSMSETASFWRLNEDCEKLQFWKRKPYPKLSRLKKLTLRIKLRRKRWIFIAVVEFFDAFLFKL